MDLHAITHCWYDESGDDSSLCVPYQKVVGIFKGEQLGAVFLEIISFFEKIGKPVKNFKHPDGNGGYFLEFKNGKDFFYSGTYTVGELRL
jgi:hypothetical protein